MTTSVLMSIDTRTRAKQVNWLKDNNIKWEKDYNRIDKSGYSSWASGAPVAALFILNDEDAVAFKLRFGDD